MTFAYRCYSCGFKLGDGIPPLVALDAAQRHAIGIDDRTGLRIGSGLSGYSFCTFCLLFEEEYGTMNKAEHPHYQFSDLGRTEWIDYPDSIGEYYDPVFANWNLMIWTQDINSQDLPEELLLMWIDRHHYVEEMTMKIENDRLEREAEAAKLHNRIRSFFRTLYFRAWEKVPYHLIKGIRVLIEAITLPRDLTEDEQMELYEILGEEVQIWQYENRISDPFAKFELWARSVLDRRFFHLYDN